MYRQKEPGDHGPPPIVRAFMAFPSATMTGVSAFIVGVGVQRTSQRAAGVVILITFGVALIVTGRHWLSDIIAGTYLGVVSGAAVLGWLRRREE
jgi:membrane-associated phospholipid phosphatase